MTAQVLDAIAYAWFRVPYADSLTGVTDGEGERVLDGPDDLRPMIRPTVLHVLSVARCGMAYTGLQLRCSWRTNDIGVLMHAERVLRVGGAEVATDAERAWRDAGNAWGPIP